jgi:eukaryotic-like serine/threonine-protein kinase
VLHHITAQRTGFRDVAQRIRRAELMVETAEAPAVKPADGKLMLGRYEVQRELGKGAMGIVYLGRDPQIGRVVAIKTVALGDEFDAEELAEVKERFFREAETAGKLAHPHIVTIYDAGESEGLAFIAMELLRGHDLSRHVKPDTLLPVTSVIELGAQAADALDYAHAQGVIHRDIKPANLVYERARRTVKITDFGIARITSSSRTRTGLVLGTPSYMSPEQLTGKPFDGRADTYSLGITLYQLLTGQLPFRADSMASLVQRISLDAPMQASELRPELPLEIDAILERAMHKDPAKRYQKGADLARALRGLHSEEGDLWE